MYLRKESAPERRFAGKRVRMSLVHNRTRELWKAFMPLRKNMGPTLSQNLFSLEVYDPDHFTDFNPAREFEKWAAVEVGTSVTHLEGLEIVQVPAGEYAVFLHRGPVSEGPKTYQYIFTEWLPGSGYQIDQRPHFAVMGAKYSNDGADSEEEIWIPIKK